jgi:hypothetical protein
MDGMKPVACITLEVEPGTPAADCLRVLTHFDPRGHRYLTDADVQVLIPRLARAVAAFAPGVDVEQEEQRLRELLVDARALGHE